MMSANIAPGLGRKGFGFEHLLMHDAPQWGAIFSDAKSRAERGRAAQLPEFRGYDWDPAVIRRAQENIARVGLENVVRVSCKSVSELTKPTHRPLPIGLLVCNPPYGERIGDKEQLAGLYRQLGEAMLTQFPGWQAAVLTSDLDLGKATGPSLPVFCCLICVLMNCARWEEVRWMLKRRRPSLRVRRCLPIVSLKIASDFLPG